MRTKLKKTVTLFFVIRNQPLLPSPNNSNNVHFEAVPPLFKTGISPFFPHPFSSYSSAFRGECFSLHMPRRPFTPIVDAGSLEVEMITVLAKALEILYANGVNSLLHTDYL